MSYCPKCGNKIEEEMSFCPKCGAALKVEQAPARIVRQRVDEKREKAEKNEKMEKHEKRGYSFVGPLIGGLILIFIGLSTYLEITGMLDTRTAWAFFLMAIGIVVIVGALYGVLTASRRHPRV
jgi:predicted nucleic acid-binding Zn ribbon protein